MTFRKRKLDILYGENGSVQHFGNHISLTLLHDSHTLSNIVLEFLELKHQVDFLSLIVPGEVTSVYVRNLPANVTEAEIDLEFKNFGRIKPDGIFIRVRKVTPHSSN